jgi:non-SMC mitotic condensation complex subunit 1
VFILDALAGFQAESPKDAEAIIERVTPRLQHANSAVVLSAVKVWNTLLLCWAQSSAAFPDADRGSHNPTTPWVLVTLKRRWKPAALVAYMHRSPPGCIRGAVSTPAPLQVIFRQMEVVGGETPDRALLRKITPSLVTLLAAEPEIQCAQP